MTTSKLSPACQANSESDDHAAAAARPRRGPGAPGLRRRARQAAAWASLCAALLSTLGSPLAQASPISVFAPFDGEGNLVVFDAQTGLGGWVGAIHQTPPPAVPEPLDLVTVVNFQWDATAQALVGSFTFTRSSDLGASLYGVLSGIASSASVLDQGGQFSIDYTIQGGTGDLAGADGYGLAFVDFDPAAGFNNYREAGLLVFSVPEPGSAALFALGLLGLLPVRRRPV